MSDQSTHPESPVVPEEIVDLVSKAIRPYIWGTPDGTAGTALVAERRDTERRARAALAAAVPALHAAWERDIGIYGEIKAERERAHAKHGATSMESTPADDPTGRRYHILSEEVGEVAKEFNDAEHFCRPVDLALLRKELIQVAAMAAAWADRISARGAVTETKEDQK